MAIQNEDLRERRIELEEERRKWVRLANEEWEHAGGIPRKLCDAYLSVFGIFTSPFDHETPSASPALLSIAIMVLFFGGWYLTVTYHGYDDLLFIVVGPVIILLLLGPINFIVRIVRKRSISTWLRRDPSYSLYANAARTVEEKLKNLR